MLSRKPVSAYRIAMLSVHTCPLAVLGGKEAGGMNVYVRELSKELGRRGVGVDVFTRSQNPIQTFTHTLGPNARVVHLPAGPLKAYNKNRIFGHLPQFVENVRQFAREHDSDAAPYDIVHGHYWLSGWAGLMLRKKWRTPVVTMFHTLAHLKNDIARSDEEREPLFRAEREAEIMQHADRIVAATPVEKAQLTWRYGANADRIETIPCGVDLKLFHPIPQEEARQRVMELVPEFRARRMVLLVGRIEPIKGVDILIEAVRQLQGFDADDLQVLIVGGGTGAGVTKSGRSMFGQLLPVVDDNPEAAKLRALVTQYGLADQILFVPSQPQEQMPYFYSAADVSVMCSRYESFGMAALEAQACGTPVIASRVGGLPSAVQHGYSGELITPERPAELTGALARLLRDGDLRVKLGQQAAIRAEQFGWRAIADNLLALYEQLASPAAATKLASL
jgi:D-inositol-3-phosphate glycosyltransferase